MSSRYVADFVAENEHDAESEREHFERETESIPEWMDEERITARAYEGEDLVDNYTRTRYAETPEDIDERIKAYQENYGETPEERVRAYQAEEEPISEREDAERSYEIEQRERAYGIRAF